MSRLRFLDIPPRLESGPDGHGRAVGTLVLIHGFPLSAHMWEPQFVISENGWRMIVPHLRGFDQGPDGRSATSMDDYAGDVIDLLDSLHVDHAVIGGLSMGGYVTFALLRHAPSYFQGLILADTRPQADTPEGKQGRERMQAMVRDKGPAAVADEMMPKLLGETTRRERSSLADEVRAIIVSNGSETIAGALTAMMTRPDSTPTLTTIKVPTLIVVGEEDTITPPQLSVEMHEAIHGSELVRIPQAGHMANLEQPKAFNDALAGFLARRF
jgi:pimeloyl-ACP methyl ester carboxylesterase